MCLVFKSKYASIILYFYDYILVYLSAFLIGHTNNLCIHSSHHFVCLPNSGVCGITQDGSTNYDDWLDSNGQPMPWTSQGLYQQGQIIDIEQTITAHHNGHIEMWACPLGRLCTMNDFKNNKLEFIDDVG